jgi:ABC-type transport system involved in multi-copper enzyme maturation permease subunit
VIAMLAVNQGLLFGIGAVIFIAVFTAALGLAYARFEELGNNDQE